MAKVSIAYKRLAWINILVFPFILGLSPSFFFQERIWGWRKDMTKHWDQAHLLDLRQKVAPPACQLFGGKVKNCAKSLSQGSMSPEAWMCLTLFGDKAWACYWLLVHMPARKNWRPKSSRASQQFRQLKS